MHTVHMMSMRGGRDRHGVWFDLHICKSVCVCRSVQYLAEAIAATLQGCGHKLQQNLEENGTKTTKTVQRMFGLKFTLCLCWCLLFLGLNIEKTKRNKAFALQVEWWNWNGGKPQNLKVDVLRRTANAEHLQEIANCDGWQCSKYLDSRFNAQNKLLWSSLSRFNIQDSRLQPNWIPEVFFRILDRETDVVWATKQPTAARQLKQDSKGNCQTHSWRCSKGRDYTIGREEGGGSGGGKTDGKEKGGGFKLCILHPRTRKKERRTQLYPSIQGHHTYGGRGLCQGACCYSFAFHYVLPAVRPFSFLWRIPVMWLSPLPPEHVELVNDLSQKFFPAWRLAGFSHAQVDG